MEIIKFKELEKWEHIKEIQEMFWFIYHKRYRKDENICKISSPDFDIDSFILEVLKFERVYIEHQDGSLDKLITYKGFEDTNKVYIFELEFDHYIRVRIK